LNSQKARNTILWKSKLADAIKETYQEVDRDFFNHESELLKERLSEQHSGTTAISVVFHQGSYLIELL
jgi:hypothetical protein